MSNTDNDTIQLELDGPALPAKHGPKAAPAITTAPAPALSPLDAGRASFLAATDPDDLYRRAQEQARLLQHLPTNHVTRAVLRVVYAQLKVWLTLAAAWREIWAPLARAVTEHPQYVRPFPAPAAAPAAPAAAPAPAAHGTLLDALQGAAGESAANAATQGAGSLAGGQLRTVGFTTAEGYVTALRNGVKAGTAASYRDTLRNQFGWTVAQVAALTVTILPEGDLPVGEGVTFVPAGPDVFDAQRQARAAAQAQLRATADAATVALAQQLVAKADSTTAWLSIGWRGVGNISRGELLAACGEAPMAKVTSTQLTRALDGLRGQYDAARIDVGLPAGVRVRWQIGRGSQHAAYVGAEYGRVLAIVDLHKDGTLHWEGDQAICAEVQARFKALVDEEVLRPGDVTAWLSALLCDRFGAIEDGHDYLVPPEHRDAARTLCRQISRIWGTAWKQGGLDADGKPEVGRLVDSVGGILGGILQGVTARVEQVEQLWAQTVAQANGKPVGARAAATALARIDGEIGKQGLAAFIDGYRILGEGPLAALRARVTALRVQIQRAVDAADGTAQRFAVLELD